MDGSIDRLRRQRKLCTGDYQSADDCESDIRLMFTNCFTYNGKEVLTAGDAKDSLKVSVPIYFSEPQRLIKFFPVRALKRVVIPAAHEGRVHVDLSTLPPRDFLFSGKTTTSDQENILIKCADSPVDSKVREIYLRGGRTRTSLLHSCTPTDLHLNSKDTTNGILLDELWRGII